MSGGQVYGPTLTALTSHFALGQGTEQGSKSALKGEMRFVRKNLVVKDMTNLVAMLWRGEL